MTIADLLYRAWLFVDAHPLAVATVAGIICTAAAKSLRQSNPRMSAALGEVAAYLPANYSRSLPVGYYASDRKLADSLREIGAKRPVVETTITDLPPEDKTP